LVAYVGRAIDDTEPRYKLPAGFQKSLVVFNLHVIATAMANQASRVAVVVEGFFDCMKLCQAGFPAVALMGSSLSPRQAELLAANFTGVVLMLDGDAAGRECTDKCLVELGRRMWVKAVMLPDGIQPDQLSEEELMRCVGL
jgi:DNA primase